MIRIVAFSESRPLIFRMDCTGQGCIGPHPKQAISRTATLADGRTISMSARRFEWAGLAAQKRYSNAPYTCQLTPPVGECEFKKINAAS